MAAVLATPRPTLPSADAAVRLWTGEPGGFLGSVESTLARAGLIALALVLAGERKHVIRYALAGAAVIEASVILLIGSEVRRGAADA